MGTDWAKLIAMRFVQIVLIAILIILFVTVMVGWFTKKPIDMWGLKFNTKDTVHITKHDTITLYKYDDQGRKSAKLNGKSTQNAEVISNNQKGGQTAKEIHNNNR
jgi:hypothetical protein